MRVLGIETSCDETGVAVYDTELGLRAHALHTQAALHQDYGGVVPELASRDHILRLLPLVDEVLAQARLTRRDLDGVAYTEGPGLIGALLTGATLAKTLAWALAIPALGVHHLEGHLLAPLLEEPAPAFPFLALIVSGGHSLLMDVAGVGRYALLGDTLDDAAGEAFDKTAKLLGLGYPGGPALARLAESGDSASFRFARPLTDRPTLDFSFSGLKTQVLLAVQRNGPERHADIAAGFQAAVVDTLVWKCLRALDESGRERLVVAGGVGANLQLRERLREGTARRGASVHFPRPAFCTDNGAMIALAGALRLAAGEREDASIHAAPRRELASLTPP
ncbi:MAG: tRNA (adenosine(37)-N6)-threonylcarbamoyltransferase complex transferase subunit TsaD [Xanthomonadales bacterium]|nr:tRNA N6-adenosine threonylcarbamoyltransferase [Xanthomonadales bacterium]MCC6593822.1 tRNA (adenosine(37)-N6)-threonylcarbamoyltransferase complex transferase subunit TsaD [Xanthomonadales bacterium]MCE7932905.1 tRNA (adenosine(37)-N6)-threonylcarbamoyltransferase complex transferase subunit TsaD [Xanthomonadales bacterium PRO6]